MDKLVKSGMSFEDAWNSNSIELTQAAGVFILCILSYF